MLKGALRSVKAPAELFALGLVLDKQRDLTEWIIVYKTDRSDRVKEKKKVS